MSRATPATRTLDAAKVAYQLHTYDYDADAANIGQQAAAALGIEPARMLKTLMIELDGKPACAILPVDHELSLKKFAAALGGKHAAMLAVPIAERITGYHVGGISPFGQKKRVPVALEARAFEHATIYCNGGQRGLQVELDPREIVRVLQAKAAAIVAEN
jgi:Cys-tRNA(Pro)/Cys-tRNA(Cys) deacylase